MNVHQKNGQNASALASAAMEQGCGILRLAPAWVPRAFCRPGMRIKLHPSDTYVLGLARGGIDERWLASTQHADNGPGTPADEGMSYVALADGSRVLLREVIDELGAQVLGEAQMKAHGGWSMFSKFFDNQGPLPHHIHHRPQHAARVGAQGKPEMYFFPSQLNNHGGEFPFTFFGLVPRVTREQVRDCLANFAKGDNQLLALSQSYKLSLDTGWDVPPGVLHAPGSLCTYEPQFASDVYAMYQSVLYGGHAVPEELLWKDCPPEERGNVDYLMEVIDWEANVDPDFYPKRFMAPVPIGDARQRDEQGYGEEWICYRCPEASAKRLTVLPGRAVTIRDAAAYGIICLSSHGRIGTHALETPALIRYGQLTNDEYFVSEPAARAGVTYVNLSSTEDMVILKHFARNPDLPAGL